MKPYQVRSAHIATSIVFFYYYGIILASILWLSCGLTSFDLIFVAVPLMFSLVSFLGSLGLIVFLKGHTRPWFFGLPLCVTLAAFTAGLYLTGLGRVNALAYSVPLFLLAPCSTVLFLAYRSLSNIHHMVFVWISLGASVLSVIALFQELSRMFLSSTGPVGAGYGMIVSLLSMLVGLPVIGLLFLVLAWSVEPVP